MVAAGNSNRDAPRFSPASVGRATTVGASSSTNAKESYSNYGDVVDMYAAGGSIYSKHYTGDMCYRTMSGTSMAIPTVAEAVACVMAANPLASCSNTDVFVGKLKRYVCRQVGKPQSYRQPGQGTAD